MRLYQLGKKLFWDPADLDFRADSEDWEKLESLTRKALLQLTVLFGAGEEAVTWDLSPLMSVLTKEGRLEEQMYLEQFLFEESKHTEGVRQGTGLRGALLGHYLLYRKNPSYRKIFYEELPRAVNYPALTDGVSGGKDKLPLDGSVSRDTSEGCHNLHDGS
ncbi:hypothetical protein HS1genome_2195 [Sulfodiicoccus acidiphilus]|uniref:Uncharacterized protein n=1 Tax=Sulfodiicoccus acidiphilus TaxID=1670455 RepID=A0A348B6K4_9CREN|nr:hypothetical protein [Sulfodiicoccus acidiphilus]BBD73806.1 hypothetical protein HS1genome_2195 [Sulfodiicoccus acidiphilus]GGU03596.1 hypothetical protein GCM10007116_20560 [Sulfodiicoccus acidiphilus]